MSVETAVRRLRLDPQFNRNVTTWQTLPEQPARTAPFPTDLDPRLAAVLRAQGIDSLYSHQAAAWTAARAGENWVVVTPTASGKTLC
ncbi:MAG: ATP-dependent helicase, partial [Anaerolineae bacterium]|nr:ATP-dependent helicase [Anaerolineae bacterium]